MNLKFTGVNYDYNNVRIQIAEDVVGASKIGISGVKIGTAEDFDRIMNLYPGNIQVKDDVNNLYYNFTTPNAITTSAITLYTGSAAVQLIKSDKKLLYKGTI